MSKQHLKILQIRSRSTEPFVERVFQVMHSHNAETGIRGTLI